MATPCLIDLDVELHGECAAGASQPRLHRPHRQGELPGDLLHRQVKQVIQDDHLAVSSWQPGQRRRYSQPIHRDGRNHRSSLASSWASMASRRRARRRPSVARLIATRRTHISGWS